MEIRLEKRPFWGIDKYLHYLVLVLSGLNFIEKLPRISFSTGFNLYASLLLSLIGVLYFFLEFKEKKGGFFVGLLWAVPQFVIYHNAGEIFDLSQGYTIPIQYSKTSLNSYILIGINILSLLVIVILVIKRKNRYRKLIFQPIKIEKMNNFTGEIIRIFSFGENKKLLVLDVARGIKSYVIQIDSADDLKDSQWDKTYLLYEMDTSKVNEATFKAYELKQLGEVTLN